MTDRPLPPLEKVPSHVGIIMDGNGRWAKAHGVPRAAGHRAGTEILRSLLSAAVEFGIPILTIFAFSTENWTRSRAEVSALMSILDRALRNELDELHANGVRLRQIGRREGVPRRLLGGVLAAEELTQDNDTLLLNIAFNYGGRAEIVDAVRAIVAEGTPVDEIDETTLSGHMGTAGQPDPDLIIRTAGDERMSNFLIWQAAYAELYFTPTLWPDFGREALYAALQEYGRRQRRFGGRPDETENTPS